MLETHRRLVLCTYIGILLGLTYSRDLPAIRQSLTGFNKCGYAFRKLTESNKKNELLQKLTARSNSSIKQRFTSSLVGLQPHRSRLDDKSENLV
jgi:hypothetical protein